MAFSSFGLPAPGLPAPGLAPQLNLNGGQQGQELMLAADRGGLGLNQIPETLPSPLSETYINFAKKWAAIYHGKATPESIHPRLLAHQRGERRPKKDALGNMEAAVKVFKGDTIKAPGIEQGRQWTGEEITQILTRIGSVETGFSLEQKKQRGGGPARSYWQVEPETALNLLTDKSKVLFGQNFEQRFSRYKGKGISAVEHLGSLSEEEMSKILFEDGDLAATLAMGKWISGLQEQARQEDIKNTQGIDI